MQVLEGTEHELLTLMRHGEGQTMPAHQVPHAANAFTMAQLKPDYVLSLGTAGSISSRIGVGELGRISEFSTRYSPSFGEAPNAAGIHRKKNGMDVCFSWPSRLSSIEIQLRDRLRYVQIRGPEPATSLDASFFHELGFDSIGMTLAQENAQLVHFGLSTASLCFITDSCGRSPEKAQWEDLVAKGPEIVLELIGLMHVGGD